MIDPTFIPHHLLPLMSEKDKARFGKAGKTVSEAVAVANEQAELDLQADIASYLRLHEIEYIKPDGRKKSPLPPGWPDFTLCYRGVAVGMEAKTAIGKLSSDQVSRHEAMRRNGWRMLVVRSLADVQALLRSIDDEVSPARTILRGQSDHPPTLAPKIELDWVLAGNPKNQGDFWHAAAQIFQLMNGGKSPSEIYAWIEKIAEQQRKEEK